MKILVPNMSAWDVAEEAVSAGLAMATHRTFKHEDPTGDWNTDLEKFKSEAQRYIMSALMDAFHEENDTIRPPAPEQVHDEW